MFLGGGPDQTVHLFSFEQKEKNTSLEQHEKNNIKFWQNLHRLYF